MESTPPKNKNALKGQEGKRGISCERVLLERWEPRGAPALAGFPFRVSINPPLQEGMGVNALGRGPGVFCLVHLYHASEVIGTHQSTRPSAHVAPRGHKPAYQILRSLPDLRIVSRKKWLTLAESSPMLRPQHDWPVIAGHARSHDDPDQADL